MAEDKQHEPASESRDVRIAGLKTTLKAQHGVDVDQEKGDLGNEIEARKLDWHVDNLDAKLDDLERQNRSQRSFREAWALKKQFADELEQVRQGKPVDRIATNQQLNQQARAGVDEREKREEQALFSETARLVKRDVERVRGAGHQAERTQSRQAQRSR